MVHYVAPGTVGRRNRDGTAAGNGVKNRFIRPISPAMDAKTERVVMNEMPDDGLGQAARVNAGSLGMRLRQRRRQLGWTQAYLAEQVGTSQAVIQKIENGKSLRPRILEPIALALSVRPAWLMFGVQEVGELDADALELARAWSRLREPHRSAMKDAIMKIGAAGRPPAPDRAPPFPEHRIVPGIPRILQDPLRRRRVPAR